MVHFSQLGHICQIVGAYMEKNLSANDSLEYSRALVVLERLENPQYLIDLWRMIPTSILTQPWPERCNPWTYGLENLIY